MTRARFLAVLAACVFGLAFACSEGFPPEFPAADFSLKSPLTGSETTLASIRGKPAIIYWFTSW